MVIGEWPPQEEPEALGSSEEKERETETEREREDTREEGEGKKGERERDSSASTCLGSLSEMCFCASFSTNQRAHRKERSCLLSAKHLCSIQSGVRCFA